MKIVAAPESFKGTCSAPEVAAAIAAEGGRKSAVHRSSPSSGPSPRIQAARQTGD